MTNLPKGWTKVALGEVCEINPRPRSFPDRGALVSFLGMSSVNSDGTTTKGDLRPLSEVMSGYTLFQAGDVLVAKITPCFENGKIAQARPATTVASGSTEFHVVRPREAVADARYVLHYLRSPMVRAAGERRMTGSAGQRRVPPAFLVALPIPLPPIEEQRRIAAILDKADDLRAQRRAALAHLDTLTRAIFLDMFGGRAAAGAVTTVAPLADLLAQPLRNGVSPCNAGTVSANVLTLAAITGVRFSGSSVKCAAFASDPPSDRRVSSSDFLICRGSGNANLVGRGQIPERDMPDVVFPDTMIAARIDQRRLLLPYLSEVWRQPSVRQQLRAKARTTNGTHKVNQESILETLLPLPSISDQAEFGRRVRQVRAVDIWQRTASDEVSSLFSSLRDRAFRGEL